MAVTNLNHLTGHDPPPFGATFQCTSTNVRRSTWRAQTEGYHQFEGGAKRLSPGGSLWHTSRTN